ncbi:nuclease-related domain-containing DEAD/DEAH box helicase [Cellulosimicrobium cellulans]|uniref:nuclease-related domain-containing DEAD/DEAH box helicase n=1 Tax=Cellulosimicrobium cellulans TaxID=1710 RepID=UPI0019595548|nr:NERD domain-containing protein [Cellulosimicrobium cellulans]
MIPAFCPEDAPPGEKALYTALATDRATDDWVVLHSMGIARHTHQVEGEADFVVVAPDAGILVIEVKSHLAVRRRDDGLWVLGNDAPKKRGPFEQAREARYSIGGYLKRKGIDLDHVAMPYSVWFTHVRARTTLPESVEWHPWQVLDSEDLRIDAAEAVRRTLTAGALHLREKRGGYAAYGTGPSADLAARVVSALRPRFEIAAVHGDVRRARREQLVEFVEEQYQALDSMSDNHAVLFTGPAGSGKTFLAAEAARREVAQGSNGQLFCFNRFLGVHLATEMSTLSGLRVGTFHQELLRLAGETAPPNADSTYWEEELPDRAIEALLATDEPASDFLVVDEVQDLVSERYLDVLDLIVEGGLAGGRILAFGDFERQALFSAADGRDTLRARAPHLVHMRLTENCRNLPRIGYQVNLFSGLNPGYRRFRRQDDGVDPTLISYKDSNEQQSHLVVTLRMLKDEGYDLNEIVVLSPLRDCSTASLATDPWLRQVLQPINGRPAKPGRVRFGTVHSFKGLDAPAVVVTDLDNGSVANFDSVLYVALTRATDRLVAYIEAGTYRAALGGAA